MEQQNEIWKELEGISPLLAAVQKVNVFNVPVGYFNKLAERITLNTLLNDDENHALSTGFSDVKKMQEVPQGYFDSLSDSILLKIKKGHIDNTEEEFTESFPLLNSLPKRNVFDVPENYFENLSDEIISKLAKNTDGAKVISMRTRWWKYAAAAVISGAIAISSLQLFNGASVEDNDATAFAVKVADQFKTPGQLEEGFASLSDDEIIKYLQKHGSILDNDLLIMDVDATELPEVDDYLSDENTLNNYLNKIDAESSN